MQYDGELGVCMLNIASMNCTIYGAYLFSLTGAIAAAILSLGIAGMFGLLLYVMVVYRHRLRLRGECVVMRAAASRGDN